MSETREENIFMAKLAEEAQRYENMMGFIITAINLNSTLSVEERALFFVSAKNIVGALRASLRIISSIEQKEAGKGNERNVKLISEYKKNIEGILKERCDEIIKIIEGKIIPNNDNDESKVFFLTMKADYYSYLSEILSGEERSKIVDMALENYQAAVELAVKLPPTNAIRLGLALNFSVFYYEILNNPEKAVTTAKQAFDDAISELDNLSEDEYKDSTLIMQLLRDNLTLWTSDDVNP